MKPFRLTILLLALGISVGCAAPPFTPAPTINYQSLTWNPSTDPNVTGYNVYAAPPAATNWTLAASVPATTLVASGILTNFPSGTVYGCTSTNSVNGNESVMSNLVTNNIIIAPLPPGQLKKQ